MKLFLLFILVSGLAYTLPAQHLERTVTGTAGDYHAHPTMGNLHWTAGEIAVEEFQNGEVLSQGFQQGYTINIISAINEEIFEKVTVKVFPNPTNSWIQLETDLPGTLEVNVSNLLGQILVTHTGVRTGDVLNLQLLPPGIYLLRIMQQGQPIRTFRIQKVDD